MTVPGRDSSARPDRRKGERRTRARRQSVWEAVLGALILLAIVASVIMIFTDSVPLLRFGVVAALWAAVVGAIAMTKFRKDSENDAARARDLKLVYELQLEREIAARREYELVVESQVRRQVEERVQHEASEELESLRMEMAALRASLEALFDGELPDERLAVRAESHRLHELSGGPGQMVAAQAAELPEIDEVVAVDGIDDAGAAFEPDYEAYRQAAQDLPGTGDEAPVTAETQVIPDGVDDEAVADADDAADAELAEAAVVDDAVVEEDEVATDSARRVPAEEEPAEDEPVDAYPAEDEHADDEVADDEADEEDTSEHGTRPGGNTVAELLARMRETGSVPDNLGRRRRRAQD
ncbi:DUF6779 domain-containing protein [Tomitella gaofuii]|uniref:DUF6779 domain-containing protein n=1 Tax=Tomitella gaofuii TaxID=2760083 RepID=UPI0015FD1098|nr:DUF6779 domain-containing protein [Tomitella gaofuii]